MTAKPLFDLQANETVLRSEAAVWIRGGLKNRIGTLWLTNQRLVFTQMNPLLAPLFGLIGLLLERFFSKKKAPALNLPLRSIVNFERTTFGLNKKVILFHTSEGDQKIGVNRPYEEWEPVLKEALKRK